MKNLIMVVLGVMSISSFATFDVDCGPKANGSHRIELHVEDEGGNPPEHWNLFVNGKDQKPHSYDGADIHMKKSSIQVLIYQTDEEWTDYRFDVSGSCEETYDQSVSVYQVTPEAKKLVQQLSCRCIED